MEKKTPRKRKKLFQPDSIATEIHRALLRDFTQAQHEYCLNEDTVLYGLNRQVSEFTKKYLSEAHDKDVVEAETFSNFKKVNSHMEKVNSELKDYFKQINLNRINQHTREPERIFLRARALMHFVLRSDCRLEDVFQHSKNSAGSSIGVPYSNTSPEAKFTFPISVTKRAKPLLMEYFSWDFVLAEAVEQLNSRVTQAPYNIVEGSRATTVDKTTDKRRFICVEPTGNMFLQQGLMHMMYERLASVGIVLPELPDLHKWKSKLASISGSDATIDWSSASDCVSIEVLRWLLPPAWFRMVMDLRCDSTTIQGVNEKLHMISSMGNATTFPLETLVFWTLGIATVLDKEGSRSLFPEWDQLKTVSVFGDDCILPTRYASKFIEVCESVGFILNKEKSFIDPTRKFRESCGGDYLSGYDIRPFYLKSPTSNRRSALEPWLYIIGNSLLKKYISYFGELSYIYHGLWSTYFGLFKKYKLHLKLVPSYFPDDSGFKGGFDLQRFHNLYEPILAPVARNSHGTYSFSYCRFRYWNYTNKDHHIRYSLWLKKPSSVIEGDKALRPDFPTRERGGYVVAKAISCHWQLPALRGVMKQ